MSTSKQKKEQARKRQHTRTAEGADEYFDGIVRGLRDATEAFDSGEKLTFDTVKVPEKPKAMAAEEIIALRKQLNASQRVFACFLNVSSKTVQAWEHNINQPSGASLRLLRIIDKNHEVVRQLK